MGRRMTGKRQMNGARALVLLIVTLSAAAWTLLAPPPPASAIVGGEPTSINEVPWQALVVVVPENRLCGGSIVDAGWIATAAHCVVGIRADQIDAHVGITSISERSAASRVQLSEVIVHPEWDATRFRNDIALLRIATPVAFNARVQAIALPVGLDAATWPPVGTPAITSGWGATQFGGSPSNQLRRAQVQILGGPGDVLCGQYGANFDVGVEICAGVPAGGVDACQGDSGSPLTIDAAGIPVLAGLTSVGFECGRADFPGIFTRVTSFISWLQQYVPVATPAVPGDVRVQALANQRLRVDWSAPTVGPMPIAYRAVAVPGEYRCEVDAATNACVLTDVPAGRNYEVSVTALLPSGIEVSAEPVQVVSVNGVTSVGVQIRPRRLAQWAGFQTSTRDRIALVVRPASRDVCTRVGSRTQPRAVRATRAGLCAVQVIVTRPNGRTQRSIAYVNVST
jgi:V8-like Glu-specific endopeptidase